MVACYRRLHAERRSPIGAFVIGRATPAQQPKMLGWQEELLPVDEGPFELARIMHEGYWALPSE